MHTAPYMRFAFMPRCMDITFNLKQHLRDKILEAAQKAIRETIR
jgi:hypothetical protein